MARDIRAKIAQKLLHIKYQQSLELVRKYEYEIDKLCLVEDTYTSKKWGYTRAIQAFFVPQNEVMIQKTVQENQVLYQELLDGNWLEKRAALFIFDSNLDQEFRIASEGYIRQGFCGICSTLFHYGLDPKGMLLSRSDDSCLECTTDPDFTICTYGNEGFISQDGSTICYYHFAEVMNQ